MFKFKTNKKRKRMESPNKSDHTQISVEVEYNNIPMAQQQQSNNTMKMAALPFSYETFVMLDVFIFMVGTAAFAAFGVVSNAINVVVFYRQGILSTSTNVNLTGLAVSDFITCLAMVMRSAPMWFLYFTPAGPRPSTAFSLNILFSHIPDTSLQMTCYITAVTAFERVISVMFPFKVKRLFTARRSAIVIVSLFVAVFILNTPALLRGYLAWETHPVTNASYLNIHYSNIYSVEFYEYYSIIISSAFRFAAIGVVLILNIILFWQVGLAQKFRKIASAGANFNSNADAGNKSTTVNQTSNKETRLLRMITVISFVFTVCNIWKIPLNVVFNFVLEFNVDFHYYVMYIMWGAVAFTEVVNSSTNIFIYYKMSSRYKETFDELFNVKPIKPTL